MTEREYHYKDILLIPNYSTCSSRSTIDLSKKLGDHTFKNPIVPANMKTIINEELAQELVTRGYFSIMHRFDIDSVAFVLKMHQNQKIASISVGVGGESYETIDRIRDTGHQPDYITIDIAHGYSQHMKEMIKYIKIQLPDAFIIAGNICTREAVYTLKSWGAHAVKVGVGPGYVCTTKLMTGFSRPQFSAVLDCSNSGIPIIADGGIEHNGDIAKGLVAGGHMVMCGYILAGYEESPGKKVTHSDGRIVKEYFGSASKENKEMAKNIEGRRIDIPYRGSIWNKYQEIEESLASSCSYAGIEHVKDLKRSVKWISQGL